MADSFQHGAVTTLHNITQRSIDAIEAELQAFSAVRPMALILPSLYSELEQPALHHIVLHHVVLREDGRCCDKEQHAAGHVSDMLHVRVRL